MRRDWSQVAPKRIGAVGCRVCGAWGPLEAAHVIGRGRDRDRRRVAADEVVMLCGPFPAGCHGAYDQKLLDLYPHLEEPELAAAVRSAGGPGQALRRLSGPLWRKPGAGPELDARLARLEALAAG